MSFIKTRKLKHEFVRRNDEGEIEEVICAISDVDLEVEQGEFVAVLGHNGSGKSTLAKHLNLSGSMDMMLVKKNIFWTSARAREWFSRIRTIRSLPV